MTEYFKNKYRTESHRLRGWDYRAPGWYFVTICTHEGSHFFGEVDTGIMGLSDIGCIAWKYWYEIPEHHPHVRLGDFIVMPNHAHMTVQLTTKTNKRGVETCHGTSLLHNDCSAEQENPMAAISPKPGSLSIIINQFKGAVRTWCKQNDRGDFAWQPGFYDHIVRNQISLDRINEYICTNPEKWENDRYHPENVKRAREWC